MPEHLTPLTYVYCVVRAARRPSVSRVPAGPPGAGPARAIQGPPGIWIIAADVSASGYGADAINANLNDLEWVSARAMGHEAVVEHFAARFDTVPMKLFTIFRTDARAAADVAANAGLPAIFRKIAGCVEWSVRVTRSRASGTPRARAPRRQPAVSGTTFLLGRKAARDRSREMAARARRAAEDAYRSLSRLARDNVRKEAAVAGTGLLLDAAFLVPKRRQTSFAASARKLARGAAASGCEIFLSGPWPAYHFVVR